MKKTARLSADMQITYQIYDFLAGPCLYITVPLCIAGILRKAVIIINGRNYGLKFHAPVTQMSLTGRTSTTSFRVYPGTVSGRNRILYSVSLLFHAAIFIAPVTAAAHWILFDMSWGVMPPRIDPGFTRLFTYAAVVAGIFLILRRTFTGHVFAVSSWKDYAAMVCVLTPFVTGILAGKLAGPYETVIVIHCASAHVLLLAVGWTRLGHMVFFASGRLVTLGLIKGDDV